MCLCTVSVVCCAMLDELPLVLVLFGARVFCLKCVCFVCDVLRGVVYVCCDCVCLCVLV